MPRDSGPVRITDGGRIPIAVQYGFELKEEEFIIKENRDGEMEAKISPVQF